MPTETAATIPDKGTTPQTPRNPATAQDVAKPSADGPVDPFSMLQDLAEKEAGIRKPEKAETPTQQPVKEPDKTPESKAPEQKPDEAPAKVEGEDHSARFQRAPELRKAYNEQTVLVKTKDKQIAELQAKLKERESAPSTWEPERKAILGQVSEWQKRAEAAETELRYANYFKHPEYIEKYERPYQEALAETTDLVGQFTVTMPDGSERPGTSDDISHLTRLPAGKALAEAKSMFGDAAPFVMNKIVEMQRLVRSGQEAVKKFRNEAAELEKKRVAEAAQGQEQMSKAWEQANSQIADKFPQWFKPEDGDDEGNKRLNESRDYVMAALGNNGNIPEQQRLLMRADVLNRAIAFGREVTRRQRAEKKIKELETMLKDYEDGDPKPGDKNGKVEPEKEDSFESMLLKHAQNA